VTDPKPEPEPYTLITTPTVRRALSEKIPATVAFAAYEFITGDLLKNPRRVGGELQEPFEDYRSARRGTYRIVYRIDETARTVTVLDVGHRGDVYKPH
jgi:mRNA interferase RelE/StbE